MILFVLIYCGVLFSILFPPSLAITVPLGMIYARAAYRYRAHIQASKAAQLERERWEAFQRLCKGLR